MAETIAVRVALSAGREVKVSSFVGEHSMTVRELKKQLFASLTSTASRESNATDPTDNLDSEKEIPDSASPRSAQNLPFELADLRFVFQGRQLDDHRTMGSLNASKPRIIAFVKRKPSVPVLDKRQAYASRDAMWYVFKTLREVLFQERGAVSDIYDNIWKWVLELLCTDIVTMRPVDYAEGQLLSVRYEIREVATDRFFYVALRPLGEGIFACLGTVREFSEYLLYDAPYPSESRLEYFRCLTDIEIDAKGVERILSASRPWERPQMFNNNLQELLGFVSDYSGFDTGVVRAVLVQYGCLEQFPGYVQDSRILGNKDRNCGHHEEFIFALPIIRGAGDICKSTVPDGTAQAAAN